MTAERLSIVCGGGALPDRSDDELMLLAALGRRDAFGLLVERHMRMLSSFCGKLVCDARAGEEVAQEIWIQLWTRREDYCAQGRFVILLFTIARNRCKNHKRDRLRRSRWMADPADPPDAVDDSPDHLDMLLERDRHLRLHQALTELPAKYREVLLLRFLQRIDYPEIARIVGRSEAGVRSRVHLGLKKLRILIERGEDK